MLIARATVVNTLCVIVYHQMHSDNSLALMLLFSCLGGEGLYNGSICVCMLKDALGVVDVRFLAPVTAVCAKRTGAAASLERR